MSRPLVFYGHLSGASSFPIVSRALVRWLVAHDRPLTICDLRQADEMEAELRGVPRVSAFDSDRIVANMRALQQGVMPQRDDVETSGAGLLFAFPEWSWACPNHAQFVGYHVCDVDRVPDHWVAAINDVETQVFTPSKWCASVLRSCGVRRPISVVRHGVDPEVFCPGEKPRTPNRQPLLRFFSSSESGTRKGLPEMVTAWKILQQRRPGFAKLVVRGAGPLVRREFGGLPGVVVEVGEPMRPPAMAQVLRGTDLLLVPSRAEGFSLLPGQAVAAGTPVVSTDCTGCAEWAHSFGGVAWLETGVLEPCPPGPGLAPALDPGHLADVIEKSVAGIEGLQEEALKASETVRKRWSWERSLTGSALDRLTQG